jgi:predicted CopG family antitoxin
MSTKTIGIKEGVYDRLAAEKREDESFTDTIDRLIDTASSDWRRGFGRYSDEEGEEFERIVTEARTDHAKGFAHSQNESLRRMGFELDDDGNIISPPEDTDEDN